MKKPLAAGAAIVVIVVGGSVAFRLGWLSRLGNGTAPAATIGTGDREAAAARETAPADRAAAGNPATSPARAIIAQPGRPASNGAVELRVTSFRFAPSVGGETAPHGRRFVIVGTAWKNLVSPVEPVAFAVESLPEQLWLVADGRYAEAIATRATDGLEGHLPIEGLTIAAFGQTVSGGVAFEAPVDTHELSLVFLDAVNGHLLVPLEGNAPAPSSSLGGTSRANEIVDLAITGVSWTNVGAGAAGMQTLVVNVKGISRQNTLVDVPFAEFAFLRTVQGCTTQPVELSPAVSRPLAPVGRFLPMVPNEGQLAFTIPADTRSAMLLVRTQPGGPIDLPVLGDGQARMPSAIATHRDGSVLRVSLVGTGAPPPASFRAEPGMEPLVVDFVVENLNPESGVELQPEAQFVLVDGSGERWVPEVESEDLPCRLSGANVVPAGTWRRFSLLYGVPARQSLALQYRGFEAAGTLKVR